MKHLPTYELKHFTGGTIINVKSQQGLVLQYEFKDICITPQQVSMVYEQLSPAQKERLNRVQAFKQFIRAIEIAYMPSKKQSNSNGASGNLTATILLHVSQAAVNLDLCSARDAVKNILFHKTISASQQEKMFAGRGYSLVDDNGQNIMALINDDMVLVTTCRPLTIRGNKRHLLGAFMLPRKEV